MTRNPSVWLYPLGFTIFCLVVWEAVVRSGLIDQFVLPTPIQVGEDLVENWSYLLSHLWVTLFEAVAGLGIAIVVSTLLAFAMAQFRSIEYSLYPIVVSSQAIPKVALAPILLIWFGFGMSSKVLLAFLISFFPIVINTLAGLKSVDPDYISLARSMGASEPQLIRRIRIPSALPHFFSGLKVAAALATVGAVVGELVGANVGLGYVVIKAQSTFNMPTVFSAVVLLSALGIALFYVIVLLERVAIPWHQGVDSGR